MSSETRWSITKFAQADVGDAGDAGDAGTGTTPNPEDIGDDLPANFATRLGTLAILNYIEENLTKQANDYGLPPAQFKPALATQLENFAAQNKLKDADFLTAVSTGAGNPKAVRAVESTFIGLFTTLAETYNKTQVAQQQPIAIQYCNEPTDGSYNGGRGTGQQLWKQLGNKFETMFKNMVENLKASQAQAVQPYAAQAPQAAYQSNQSRTKTAQSEMNQQGPLSSGRYESVDQLKDDLVSMGPAPETYERFMSMVGPGNEDDAKDALASFFQGMSASLYTLYDMLVGIGLASPIDASIVENLMSQHPELSDGKGHQQHHPIPTAADDKPTKIAGLFLPAINSGVNTKSDHLEKTAGGGVGGASPSYPAYMSYGGGDNRMCPKIRQPVSTFICRYHCLDGINVDDHQTICGEAIWRQAVMDKFSREYRDKDGNWTGGYINKRFEVHYDDGGHPALLKPGERMAPIHEDAWSMEKRLAEMRKTESKERGYSETPGDGPKDLYNFDQHDLMKGPKNPQLTEKKKDAIAKIAETSSMFEKTAAGPDDPFDHVNRPLADKGLTSYRYQGSYGWIMIGAKDDQHALKEAQRSTDEPVKIEKLQVWDGKTYVPVANKGTPGFDQHPWATPEPQEQNPSDFGGGDIEAMASKKSFNLAAKRGTKVAKDGDYTISPSGETRNEKNYYCTKCEKHTEFHPECATCGTKTDKTKKMTHWYDKKAAKNDKTVSEDKFVRCKEHVKENSPGVNEYAVCTDSLGGQPASYHKKKKKKEESANDWGLVKEAWGLDMAADGGGDKMDGMGDGVNPGRVGKRCAACGKIFAAAAKVCDNPMCQAKGQPLADYNQGQAERTTGVINNQGMIPMASIEDAEIRLANGIYKASKDGASAYGDTAEQALEKLAQQFRSLDQGLAHTRPSSIDQEADQLMNFRQDEKESPMAAPNPNPVAPDNTVAPPAPAPQGQVMPPVGNTAPGKIVMDEAVPVNQSSPVPTESQGPSEFFPAEVVGPEGWKAPGEEPGPDEGHIGAQELDNHLEETKAGMHPEDHKAVVEQAISSGA